MDYLDAMRMTACFFVGAVLLMAFIVPILMEESQHKPALEDANGRKAHININGNKIRAIPLQDLLRQQRETVRAGAKAISMQKQPIAKVGGSETNSLPKMVA